ncbi:hypothetical protein [Leptospira sarikeiensis]|uniref:Uncharacterized protein n=1 Tax=Leptospira sarikeiensis TaxID=2484943 RepID=A0A4R9K578_9LEPT|nr:hypothetical protein [Leptospira sarikeiensis]TGL61368.1 hypothetical protein EHQ64_10275 [Leptospira sarikeiensis]
MNIGYILINTTKKEIIHFLHVPVITDREITASPVGAAISTWYLLKNSGDQIGFIPDNVDELSDDWPFKDISSKEIDSYEEVTDRVISDLIENQILEDQGIDILDPSEPELYYRILKNRFVSDFDLIRDPFLS